jgi:hypothetical protein
MTLGVDPTSEFRICVFHTKKVKIPGRVHSTALHAWSTHGFYFNHTNNITISKAKTVAPHSKMLSPDMKKQFKIYRKKIKKAEGDTENTGKFMHIKSHGTLPI